ncbi:MAG: hypothetical protein ACC644_03465 [Candidatus Hydrothermarchaeales archaeon]
MTDSVEQIQITGEMRASSEETVATFHKTDVSVKSSKESPVLLVFSAVYRWDEEVDGRLKDFDFYMTIHDSEGEVVHSDHKHFGEEEPGFIGADEKAFKEYAEEEAYLQVYKQDATPKSGEGTMARSIRVPVEPGEYIFICKIMSQFWSRAVGEERGREKNKVEAAAECTVTVRVS